MPHASQQICLPFLDNKCPYGDACYRIHVTEKWSAKKEYANKPKGVVCSFYPLGTCKYAENCSFLHVKPQNHCKDKGFKTTINDTTILQKSSCIRGKARVIAEARLYAPNNLLEDMLVFEQEALKYINNLANQLDELINMIKSTGIIVDENYLANDLYW
jgi:hypothetical protein